MKKLLKDVNLNESNIVQEIKDENKKLILKQPSYLWALDNYIVVIKHNGWSDNNFDFEWYRENISLEEFNRRLSVSQYYYTNKDKR